MGRDRSAGRCLRWCVAHREMAAKEVDSRQHTAEYRGILDALNSYRFVLTQYYSLYKFAMVAVPAQKKYDDDIALAKAQEAVNNAFADRIFIHGAVKRSGARKEWGDLASKLLADKSTIDDLLKMVDSVHSKLVKASQADLRVHGE